MHSNAVEIYTISLTGTVSSIAVDPNNWIINKAIGPVRDATLGITVVDPPPVDYTGISEAAMFGEIKVGPNPTKGTVIITNPSQANGTAKVFDLKGQLLLEKTLTGETLLDLGGYAKGIYVVKIYNTNNEEQMLYKILNQ